MFAKFIVLFTLPFLLISSEITPETYIGKWEIQGGSVIEIYRVQDIFYGKIFKRATNPLSNFNGLDNKNPNKELRSRPLLGIDILEKLTYKDGILSGGTIYNADSGKIYTVKVWIDSENKDLCYIRAYKSFLFKTFKAKRVN
ncbi:DUF2147 domain-containing protein [Aquimarina sp. D1M17]|uniref:DUF2147 domain-containing protein n=1 Tax=Aquimarina acroporae TaxID=2937283 RepID=UPI0020C0AB05|nr:DUF2147 domain-containing protein [Aquimarina acroporae]MCK8524158.1 DUF2147 domain-containing protein [Aquimarina acroporae]